MIKSDVRVIKLSLRDLQSVDYKKGWISAKVILEARSLKVLEDIPGTDMTECVLKIKRKDRKEAENLVSKVRITMSEMKLRDLDEDA
ncbi:MAG: hypothetical protein U5K69_05365 [Balneolaceae bacterium]|nr:hypothetical protein [Balneolaceae bacterium]